MSEQRECCEWCGGDAIPGTTCPKSIECPSCHAAPGSPCRRPSGHKAMELHADRVRAAELIDDLPNRTAAFLRYVAAGTDNPEAAPVRDAARRIIEERAQAAAAVEDAPADLEARRHRALRHVEAVWPNLGDIDAETLRAAHDAARQLADEYRADYTPSHALRVAAELRVSAIRRELDARQRADDDQRAMEEGDEQRDYAEERYNAALLAEEAVEPCECGGRGWFTMNEDEVQRCDDCGRFDTDEDAARALMAAGVAVEERTEDGVTRWHLRDAAPPRPASHVEIVNDGATLAVQLGDALVFDPTGRDMRSCAVVGIVIGESGGDEEPAPLVRINATDQGRPALLCVVRRAFAVLA